MVQWKENHTKYGPPWHRQPSILWLTSTESWSYATKANCTTYVSECNNQL